MIFQYSLVFAAFLLLASSPIYGRSLQKVPNSKAIDSSQILVKKVSLATDPTYTGKTNYSDFMGLAALTDSFPQLLENNLDPCLPPKWSWIQCNSDSNPRVIALNLNNKLLLGQLPDFSTMDALQKIDLSQNSLVGTIPSFLGTFPDLQELNLAYNLFYGEVPDSIACNKDLNAIVTGNTGLYVSGSCSTSSSINIPSSTSSSANGNTGIGSSSSDGSFQIPAPRTSKRKSKRPVIIGSTASVFSVFWIAVGVFAVYRHKSKSAAAVAEATSGPEMKSPGGSIPTEEMPINGAPNNNMASPN